MNIFQQTITIPSEYVSVYFYGQDLICSVKSNKSCNFFLRLNNHILATSIDGELYFSHSYINNSIIFKNKNYENLGGLEKIMLCDWNYDGLNFMSEKPNVTLIIRTMSRFELKQNHFIM